MTAAPCLMLQGTGSGVGKSVLAAALCRIFARQGYRVAPFKSQNMALNSAVTADGGEIGRAQAAQAEAAGIEPTVDMNPILMKPEADDRSQLVVRGVPVGRLTFGEYRQRRDELLGVVAESLARLRRAHELVIIEGAGSPAEINLADDEIANMRIARLADAPVLLVGDIDRGGVFAALLGTLELLAADDRARVSGFIVNKFRGDATILAPGLDTLVRRTGVPVLGVVPYIGARLVPAEDSLDLDDGVEPTGAGSLEIAVVRLPRIANFDDFDPLAREPGITVRFVRTIAALAEADAIVLPGSKATMADLDWLRTTGLAGAIIEAARRGTPVLGICGGYQMLGRSLHDPDHVESPRPSAAGLGLLPVATTFAATKTTVRVRARVVGAVGLLTEARGADVSAYEIHMGTTEVSEGPRPFAVIDRGGRVVDDGDGAMNDKGTVLGTYLHGLFANDGLRRALLVHLARRRHLASDPRWGAAQNSGARYDRLADTVAAAVDVPAIAKLARL